MGSQYHMIFLLRRLIMSLLIVCVEGNSFGSYIQSHSLMYLSLMNICYLISAKPLETRFENYMEAFNETCVLISYYCVITLSNTGIPIDDLYKVGWALIGIAGISLGVNMLVVFVSVFQGIYETFKERNENKEEKKVLHELILKLHRDEENPIDE